MGKKSKANRKKAPVATSTATTAAAATTTAAATAATPTAATSIRTGQMLPEEFPESTFLVKGESFFEKGNHAKAQKIFLQGLENGCVRCLNEYTMKILYDGAKIENIQMVAKLSEDNIHLHLALPLLLEGAIRGNHDAVIFTCLAYAEARHETEDCSRYGHLLPAKPLTLYWGKYASKNYDRENRAQTEQNIEGMKEDHGTQCSVCEKEDSETVTLQKCDGCKLYYYCSKACQKKMWREGQHAGVCRQLGILQKYHKPFAKKIQRDIAVHGIAPKDIPELQELRQRLGLSRPQEDYQDRLGARVDSAQLILPRKDGTVQIGSFPRPI